MTEAPLLITNLPLMGVGSHFTIKSEMDTKSSCDEPCRKRQRLDHLTFEEKLMRRKLKNRVAAQSARDRKKAQMDSQEKQIMDLSCQLKKLQDENTKLRLQNEELITENKSIKTKLNEIDEKQKQIIEKSDSKDEYRQTVEYAEEAGPDGSPSFDDALRWLADVEPDEILDIFEKLGQEIIEDNLASFDSSLGEKPTPCEPKVEVVGSTTEQLESIKELILFDHIYHKSPKEDQLQMDYHNFTSESDVPEILFKESLPSEISSSNCDTSSNCEISAEKQKLNSPSKVECEDDDDVVILESTIPVSKSNRKSAQRKRNLVSSRKSSTGTVTKEDMVEQLNDISFYTSECYSDSGYESAGSLSSLSESYHCQSLEDMSLAELFPSLL